MTHLTPETFARLSAKKLRPDELMAALDHLRDCDDCAGLVDASKEVSGLRALIANSVPDAAHLDADSQLIPYVDGTLDAADREIVESHLEDCPSCRRKAADLRSAVPRRSRRSFPIALAAVIAGAAIALAVLVGREHPSSPPLRPSPPPAVSHPPAQPRNHYDDPEWEQLVRSAVERGRLPYPAEFEAETPDVIRSTGPSAAPIRVSPSGTAVAETQPEFAWSDRPGATYVVSVYLDEVEVARSPRLRTTKWKPPGALRRDRTYTWQVEADRQGQREVAPAPPAPQATFRIISEKETLGIDSALSHFPADHFLHAVLFARAGLRDAAESALRQAAATGDPAASAILRGKGR